MNAAAPLTLDFDPMVVSPNATPDANAIFFSIVDTSNMTVFDAGLLPTTTTSVTIPAGQLLPGQSYRFDLLFDDRIVTHIAVPGDESVPLTQFYDTHTGGTFSTAAGAVPEPSTWAMLLLGFIGLGVMARPRAVAAVA